MSAAGVDPVAFVESSEAAAGLDWLELGAELGGDFVGAPSSSPGDSASAKRTLCAAGCEGDGPYLVRGGRDPLTLELWVVDVDEGVTRRAPAALVASHPACAEGEVVHSEILELDYSADDLGVELYMAVKVVAPREGAGGEGEGEGDGDEPVFVCAGRRVECQTFIEASELLAGGPAEPDWACRFD